MPLLAEVVVVGVGGFPVPAEKHQWREAMRRHGASLIGVDGEYRRHDATVR